MKQSNFIKRHSSLLRTLSIAFTSTAVLALILTGLSYLLLNESTTSAAPWILFSLSFLFASLRQLCFISKSPSKSLKIDRYVGASIYFVLAVLTIVFYTKHFILIVDSFIYFVTLAIYCGLSLTYRHKVRNIVGVTLLVGACSLLALVSILTLSDNNPVIAVMLYTGVVSGICFTTILREAFAKIHLKTLKHIFEKTYAGEIFLGLLFLIVAFSFVFMILENISYADALWYCFALVTTIGFGDVTVVNPFCRVLSVLLGIYGLIVVALITSIIVNFYNENKVAHPNSSKEDTKIDEDKIE